jgi:hypothetical protein
MKLKFIIDKGAFGILGFIPLGKYGVTLYPIGWNYWRPLDGAFGLFTIRSKYMALVDYIDHHPASPWSLLDGFKD